MDSEAPLLNNRQFIYCSMAQRKEFCNSRTFSSPSPVVNPEVSAQWTRDGRGEVLISLKVPWDIVDAE